MVAAGLSRSLGGGVRRPSLSTDGAAEPGCLAACNAATGELFESAACVPHATAGCVDPRRMTLTDAQVIGVAVPSVPSQCVCNSTNARQAANRSAWPRAALINASYVDGVSHRCGRTVPRSGGAKRLAAPSVVSGRRQLRENHRSPETEWAICRMTDKVASSSCSAPYSLSLTMIVCVNGLTYTYCP